MSMAMSMARPMISVMPQAMPPSMGDNLLLDALAVQPVAAYSVARKLRSAYAGGALRCRESSINSEATIGFSGNLLDQTALLAHTGANNGLTRFVYDQRGAFDLGQPTAGAQPGIVSAGVLNTVGGRASLFANAGLSLLASDVLGGTSAELMACMVTTPRVGTIGNQILDFGGTVRAYAPFSDNAYYWDVGGATAPNRITSAAIAVANQIDILTFINSTAGSIQQIWRNGILIASDATPHSITTTGLTILNDVNSWQELIVFNSVAAVAQRDAITRNQGTFYGVTIP